MRQIELFTKALHGQPGLSILALAIFVYSVSGSIHPNVEMLFAKIIVLLKYPSHMLFCFP